jgi:hypothetical protein
LDAGFDENNGIENSKVVVFLCHGSPGCFPKQEPRNDLEICVCDVNKKKYRMRMYKSTVHDKHHLSLLQRLASGGLVGLGRASLCVQGLKVRGRKSCRVVGSLERVRCGGQALEVLAVVLVGLVVISILNPERTSSILTYGTPQ